MKDIRPDVLKLEEESNTRGDVVVERIPFDYIWYGRLTAAIISLTIGFQGVLFSVNPHEGGLSTYILAYFYGGVALAALFCTVFQLKFDWGTLERRVAGNATIISELPWLRRKANFGLMTLMAAASMVMALWIIGLPPHDARQDLFLIAAAAFIYQILVLSLLDHIGRAEQHAQLQEMIKLTYLILAVGTIMSIEVLGFFQNNYPAYVIVTLGCSLISFCAVRKRAPVQA